MSITRVYIDGFNLYHGIIRANRLHWLDLEKFAIRLNRGLPVDRIIYCTARVSSNPGDPQKAQRQDAYHRAITAACPTVEILNGAFTTHKKFQPIPGCVNFPSCVMRVAVRNEKGSDVNLASRLLHDAHTGCYERAIVVSGDSDLTEPIRLVASEINKTVWVRNPRDVDSRELQAVASDYARIRPSVLIGSQLPDLVIVGDKQYRKPEKWSQPLPSRNKVDILTATCPQPNCLKPIISCRYE